ncbi:MAG TPA: aspartate--tRNA(Asn) ligase [Solirubrobacteraceae bacterium]|nr:aspartate--tRNA(Asn) ligase [Solirubrobacteraceae bacterium]
MKLPRALVADLGPGYGERVRLCGWAHEIRPAGAGLSVVLRDHTGLAELVLETAVEDLVPESAIEVLGITEPAGGDGVRVAVERLEVVGPAATPLPITPSSTREQRLDWRYLDLRGPRNRLIFEVQTTAERALRAFCDEWRFLELHSPKLRPIPNKSGDQLFPVEYFDRRAYLAQSPQFYKQMAMAAGFDRVLEIAPVFRAQADPTSRHDTEFTSVDVEMAWIDSEEDLMGFEEQMLTRVIGAVQSEHDREVERCFGVEIRIPATPFPRRTLGEAKAIVAASGTPAGPIDEDLDPQGELCLAEQIAAEHDHEFVFITDYPDRSRPFYHMCRETGSVETRSFDLLWKGLEITSGAQREHRHDRLTAQAAARGIPVELIRPYLDFFKFGCPPHGGFGLGLTRMLMSMLAVDDVREVTYLFRGPDRLTP